MNQSAVTINNLFFQYDRIPVLQNINFKIKEKETVTILGPNGGGKTTLLKLILGLLIPDNGTVELFGKSPSEMSSIVGYVPQHAHFDKKFPVTVYDIVLSGRVKKFGFPGKKDKLIVSEKIEEFGLADYINEPFHSLSGGQLQRALIARALVTDTKILLLDEPTSNIDVSAGMSLNSILSNLKKNMTIILVTHDTGFVENITDRVLCINKSVVEHPVDKHFSQLVASSYSRQSSMVRHDKRIDNAGGEND